MRDIPIPPRLARLRSMSDAAKIAYATGPLRGIEWTIFYRVDQRTGIDLHAMEEQRARASGIDWRWATG